MRKDRERRFQPVRQVTGLGDRAPHGLLPLVEQHVDVIDERLNFSRIHAVDAPLAPACSSASRARRLFNRRYAAPHLQQPATIEKMASKITIGRLNTSCTTMAIGI